MRMSLVDKLVLFLIFPHLDKQTAKTLSCVNSELMALINKSIEKQIITFEKSSLKCWNDKLVCNLVEALNKKHISLNELKILSWKSYNIDGRLSLMFPRIHIIYGICDDYYFFLDYLFGDNFSSIVIQSYVVKKQIILLPFYKYSTSEKITDWLV